MLEHSLVSVPPAQSELSARRAEREGRLRAPDIGELEFLAGKLRSISPERRMEAAVVLGDLDHPEVTPLLAAAVRDPVPRVQLAALQALRTAGDRRAVPALCTALSHKECSVRLATAQTLAVLADERAIPAVREALAKAYRGEGYVSDNASSLLAAAFTGLLPLTAVLVFRVDLNNTLLIFLSFQASVRLFTLGSGRRDRSPYTRALTRALARIAEQCPTPELRSALEPLKRIATDRSGQERDTLAVCRHLVSLIEERTGGIKDLPSPAMPVGPVPGSLPLPTAAGRSGSDGSSLEEDGSRV